MLLLLKSHGSTFGGQSAPVIVAVRDAASKVVATDPTPRIVAVR